MSRIPARLLGLAAIAATAALVILPVAQAGPAEAAVPASARETIALDLATALGELAMEYAEAHRLDGRSTRAMRAVVSEFSAGLAFVTVSGLTDANHDGLDDDAKVRVRVFNNQAKLALHKDRTFAVTDAGFVFNNPRSVLKESAQAFDKMLRFAATFGIDSWDMQLTKEIKAEMPVGVRVVSDYDGNHDGYDDDGRLTFLARGKAVTLTIGNTSEQVGKVTNGPTWKTKAPRRTHHPVARPYQGAARFAR